MEKMMDSSKESLTLEIIRQCPNRCLHCSSSSSPEATDIIPFNHLVDLLRQAKRNRIKRIILSGGEPFDYPQLLDVIEITNSLNLDLVIYTSGSTLSNGKISSIQKSLIEKIKTIGIIRYNLSLHSPFSEIHDKFMNRMGSYSDVIEFLLNCLSTKTEVEIHTVLTKLNYNSMVKLADLLRKYDIKKIRVLKLVPQGRARYNYADLEPSETEYETFWSQIKHIKESTSEISVELGAHLFSFTHNTEYECTLNENKMTITPDGKYIVCPAFKGKVNELQSPSIYKFSLEEVFESDWRLNFIRFKEDFKFSCPAQELYKKNSESLLLGEKNINELN